MKTKYMNRFNENGNGNNESENNEQNENAQVAEKTFLQKHGKKLLIGGTATTIVAAGIFYLYRVGKKALAAKKENKADDGFEEVDDKKK
jgi:hypothetical protein